MYSNLKNKKINVKGKSDNFFADLCENKDDEEDEDDSDESDSENDSDKNDSSNDDDDDSDDSKDVVKNNKKLKLK